MNCFSCEAPLVMDPHCRGDYQYDNALWIGFHGGYGMFVDNLDAIMPNNTEDRWLRDPDGEYTTIDGLDGRPHVIDDPDWIPTFNEAAGASWHTRLRSCDLPRLRPPPVGLHV